MSILLDSKCIPLRPINKWAWTFADELRIKKVEEVTDYQRFYHIA